MDLKAMFSSCLVRTFIFRIPTNETVGTFYFRPMDETVWEGYYAGSFSVCKVREVVAGIAHSESGCPVIFVGSHVPLWSIWVAYTYVYYWSLKPFSQNYDLACVNFNNEWRDLLLKVDSEWLIFEEHFYCFRHINNWPLYPFSQDNGLASHATHVVCVNFIRQWRDLQFNRRLQRTNFWETFMTGLFTLRVKKKKSFFSYFVLMPDLEY